MKSNIELVAYCKAQLGRPYWFGTFGQIASKKLLAEKSNQYARQFSKKRQAVAVDSHLGKKVHDCYGLYKGFLMSADADSEAVYDKKYDISADTAFNRAEFKGTIDTLPADIVGVGLWKKGHFGVYIGGGKEIEARGFDYGVVEDDVKNTSFTHWFKLPEITYIADEKPAEDNAATVEPSKDSIYIVKKGDTLSKIAAKTGLTVADLVAWNSIEDPDVILVGQKLKLTSPTVYAEDKDEYKDAIVNTRALPLNIRNGASMNSAVIGTLPRGAQIKIAYETGGWAKLFGREGFVKVDFVKYM